MRYTAFPDVKTHFQNVYHPQTASPEVKLCIYHPHTANAEAKNAFINIYTVLTPLPCMSKYVYHTSTMFNEPFQMTKCEYASTILMLPF